MPGTCDPPARLTHHPVNSETPEQPKKRWIILASIRSIMLRLLATYIMASAVTTCTLHAPTHASNHMDTREIVFVQS
jgi:hypothetical protein